MAAVAVLLALAAVGLRARGTFSRTTDAAAAGASGAVLVTALAAAEGIAFIAFIVVLASARPQRPPDEQAVERWQPRFPWWAKTLAVLAAVALLVTPFVVLFTRKTARRPSVPPSLARPGLPGRGTPIAPHSAQVWPVIAGMAIAVAVVVALALLSRRRRRDGSPRTRPKTVLAESLAAAHDALASTRDPRAAIIACYATMEKGFAAAGSAPTAADTPAEVLIRATTAGIVSVPPAEALAGLFRRARYSAEPMTGADSAAATTALTQLRTDLDQLPADPDQLPADPDQLPADPDQP